MTQLYSSKIFNTFEKGPIRRSLFHNGAVSLFHEFKGMNGAQASLYFLVGSMHEKENQYGLTHVIEHMMFRNKEKLQVIMDLEYHGAMINAYTFKEYVCFELGCLADQLDSFLPKFLSLFFNPTFDKHELAIEKEVIVQELYEDLDDHENFGHEYIFQRHFGPALGHPIGGSIPLVKKFTVKDLHSYHKKYFTPDRTILSVVSGKKLINIEKIFASVMDFSKKRGVKRLKPTSRFGNVDHFSKKVTFPMESSILFLGLTGLSLQHDYYYDLLVLDEILCMGLSSKIYFELREKLGLIYAMGSSINSFINNGNYVLAFNAQPKNMKKVNDSVHAILDYYSKNEFDGIEVENIKQRIISSWKIQFDDMSNRNDYIANAEIYELLDFSVENQEKLVARVTPKRLKSLLKKLLAQGITELKIIPKAK